MTPVLAIVEGWPWPARSGKRLRQGSIVEGLAAAGELDLCVLGPAAGARPPDEAVPHLRRLCRQVLTVPLPTRRWDPIELAAWVARPTLPTELLGLDGRAVRARLAGQLGRYDQIWYDGPRSWLLVGSPPAARTVVDIDDLEDVKLAVAPVGRGAGAVRKHRRRIVGWRRLQRRIADRVDAVLVCSELDRTRIGVPNAVVVPNTYPRPRVLAPVVAGDRPRVLVPGLLTYGPNADGARWAVTRILPALLPLVPDVELRLAGRCTDGIAALAGPHVTVTGEVPDMTAEVRAADAVAVPIRYGGGTRVKILEAFALGRPVVSTSIGCEGLDVRDGEHLLIADREADLAHALATVLLERPLADRIASSGHALWAARYERSVAVRHVAALARAPRTRDPVDVVDLVDLVDRRERQP